MLLTKGSANPAGLRCQEREGLKSGMIFVTSGKALDRSNIWQEIEGAGPEKPTWTVRKYSPQPRAFICQDLLHNDQDLSKLADILGHKDINTTHIYTQLRRDDRHRKQLESMRLIVTYYAISILLYSEHGRGPEQPHFPHPAYLTPFG